MTFHAFKSCHSNKFFTDQVQKIKRSPNQLKLRVLLAYLISAFGIIYLKSDEPGHLLDVFVSIDRQSNQTSRWNKIGDSLFYTIADYILNIVPRLDYNLHEVSILFDVDDKKYSQSQNVLVLMGVIVGIIAFLPLLIYLPCKFWGGQCGGRKLPSKGYSQLAMKFLEYFLWILGFVLQIIVMYQFILTMRVQSPASSVKSISSKSADYMENLLKNLEQYFISDNSLSSQTNTLQETSNNSSKSASERSLNSLHYSEFKSVLSDAISDTRALVDKIKNIRSYFDIGLVFMEIFCELYAIGCLSSSRFHTTKCGIFFSVAGCIMQLLAWIGTSVLFSLSYSISDYCVDSFPFTKQCNHLFLPSRLQTISKCPQSPVLMLLFQPIQLDLIQHAEEKGMNYVDYCQSTDDKLCSLASNIDSFLECRYTKEIIQQAHSPLCVSVRHEIVELSGLFLVASFIIVISTIVSTVSINKFEWKGKTLYGAGTKIPKYYLKRREHAITVADLESNQFYGQSDIFRNQMARARENDTHTRHRHAEKDHHE